LPLTFLLPSPKLDLVHLAHLSRRGGLNISSPVS
jgi:hypothetical protein